MEQPLKFEVKVSGRHGQSEEDRRRAGLVPVEELPPLSPNAKEAARVMGMKEEDMQRLTLATKFAKERLESRTTQLGRVIEEILGPDYKLNAVIDDLPKSRWIARIATPKRVVNVAIPSDVGDDIVDWDVIQAREQLRVLLLTNLERSEFMVSRE